MRALIAAAHAKGMKVSSTSSPTTPRDVIDYAQHQYTYVSDGDDSLPGLQRRPSTTPRMPRGQLPARRRRDLLPVYPGLPFGGRCDGRRSLRGSTTRRCTPQTAATRPSPGSRAPMATLSRTSDDLWTERPRGRQGMGRLYKTWVDSGSTASDRHGQARQPVVLAGFSPADPGRGGPDQQAVLLHVRREIYDGNPAYVSQFTTA